MKMSEFIRKAKASIRECGPKDNEWGICVALDWTASKHSDEYPRVELHRLRDRIFRSLDLPPAYARQGRTHCTYVNSWLVAHGYATSQQVRSARKMMEYRLRWLEALAAEYEAKGE